MRTLAARIVLVWSALLPLSLLALDSRAQIITVNSTFDAPGATTLGATLDDGVCETQRGNGVCTLRAAIMEANHLPGGGATIVVPAGTYPILIAPVAAGSEADGSFDLLAPMTIRGQGPSATIVDGAALDRVFDIPAATVRIEALSVLDGNPGAAGDGGGIRNAGTLTLENVSVSANTGVYGGGIAN